MPRPSKPVSSRRPHVADWERTQKPRAWRGQGRLIAIALLALTSYAALPATLYFTFRLLTGPAMGWEPWTIFSLSALLLSLILGTLLSAMTKCSLCQGRPLLGTDCRKHQLANKIPGLTYRASAILHLIFTGKFRCMFCSTPFRLGRKSRVMAPPGSAKSLRDMRPTCVIPEALP